MVFVARRPSQSKLQNHNKNVKKGQKIKKNPRQKLKKCLIQFREDGSQESIFSEDKSVQTYYVNRNPRNQPSLFKIHLKHCFYCASSTYLCSSTTKSNDTAAVSSNL